MKFKILLVLILVFSSFVNKKSDLFQDNKKKIKICWSTNIKGDFSFNKNWSYPEGVYKNQFGQLSCDGICMEGVDQMKDENGKIFEDSLTAFYKIVDTSHTFHSIKSEAWCYEWAGTEFIDVHRINKEIVRCITINNVSTHCSLNIEIENDYCKPTIKYTGMSDLKIYIFDCFAGNIQIDKVLWNKGILKAEFDFSFVNTIDLNKPMYWRGKIYKEII